MPAENPGIPITKVAGVNVTNKRFVKNAAGGKVNRCDTQGEAASGVVAMVSTGFTGTAIPANEPVPVVEVGGPPVIMEAGGALADGAKVMTDNVGRPITFVDNNANVCLGEVANGSSAGAAGEDVAIKTYPVAQFI